jgi:hypothetical protein
MHRLNASSSSYTLEVAVPPGPRFGVTAASPTIPDDEALLSFSQVLPSLVQ